ncbi:ABC transporter permease [Fictibacillus phosphorivorans]|uniref:ABC transporter permease n=1 Tax=Fictibacillus phosphorivorans TaxID=1221500 RepID=UPI00203A7F47|nr:ABC-2 transporter permease [Fictibacillus phosphorivorans]MCM3719427.1 ABC-2 transporter permease [Fictibacillus phosphorivorans]MCM3777095.1 ABC-2 transporter permease [Fictibacillus phosphorivorans]
MDLNIFANTGKLSRFILRLDQIRIPLWIIGLAIFTFIVPPTFENLYETQQDRTAITETMKNPAMIAMLGTSDFDNYSIGVMTAHNMLLMTAVIVGLMAIFLVTRHTRADEEDGRVEMIRSLPSGRLSYLNATLIVTSGSFIILALLISFGLYAMGIESMDLEGSFLYGIALGGTGLIFAGVTAVFAQLTESSRGTIGWSVSILLFFYLFRAVTDISNEALSWFSPLGWVSKAEVYSSNQWGPIVLMLGVSLVLFILANFLNSIRDLEQGFIASKPGRRNATRLLQSPLGLAFRLQRTGFICWAIGMYVLGASYGSVFGDLESFFEGNEMYQQMLKQTEGASIAEQFIPTVMLVISLLATVPPVMAMNKLRNEEKKDRLDHLLSRAVSRTQLIGSYLILAIVNGGVMISLSALGLWSAATSTMEEGLEFGMVFSSALVFYPAMLVMIGIAAFLIGFLPKMTSFIWIYFLYSFFVLYIGNLMELPKWVGQLSPFGHVPQVPIEEATFLPLFLLSIVAVGLMIISFVGFRNRDIQ